MALKARLPTKFTGIPAIESMVEHPESNVAKRLANVGTEPLHKIIFMLGSN